MIIARIIDNVWATRKADQLSGLKFMLAEEIRGDSSKNRIIAVDVIGAGIGDRVIISTGSSAREMIGRSVPVDAIVVGIIDEDCKLK
ncbi:EutN/CcmL family microcompartment protein [Cetobacterium somerae]|uniref:EutN/CcmL family microcompartment protein n=1 Tax=Cetobacterium sp. NK01 TaxID=2993530 RepID=UPI002116CDB8|nr:EutN/CcmL family microcompartment protein [Cetobacterium sp. NK01]MCQ8212688.1 EutN/CcmL family microcompartment protein [Cetobacterium sp. NK01]